MRMCLSHGLYEHRKGGQGCPVCVRERDAARGTRRERGIGPNHERFAEEIEIEMYPCSVCGEPYGNEDNPITVGHIVSRVRCLAIGKDPDDPSNLIPECRRCNLRKGA